MQTTTRIASGGWVLRTAYVKRRNAFKLALWTWHRHPALGAEDDTFPAVSFAARKGVLKPQNEQALNPPSLFDGKPQKST